MPNHFISFMASTKKMQSNHAKIKKAHKSFEKEMMRVAMKMDDKTLRKSFAKSAAVTAGQDELFRRLMKVPEIREQLVGDTATKESIAFYTKQKKSLKAKYK